MNNLDDIKQHNENSHTKSKNISFQLKKSGYTQKVKTKLTKSKLKIELCQNQMLKILKNQNFKRTKMLTGRGMLPGAFCK